MVSFFETQCSNTLVAGSHVKIKRIQMHEYRTADGIDELQAATGSVARVLARLYTLGAFTVLLTRARTGLCHTTHIT